MVLKETKVTFTEGSEVRVLRGFLEAEDINFITIKRRDGIHKINKRFIISVVDEEDPQ